MKKLFLLLFASLFASANMFAGDDDPIVFEDPLVEKLCIEKWDYNKDGKFSYKEAAGIKSIGMTFAKNMDITKFNEFQYFTGVKYTEEFAFEACVLLEEITMPASMESLEKGSFCDASSLTKVTLNEGLKYIGEGCFANCSAIETIDIPETVEKFGASAFHKCNSLVSVKIPHLVEYLPVELFNGCMSLETVTLQEGLKGIGNSAFNECYNLQSISLPSTFKSFGMWVFWDCFSIQKYEVAESNPNFTSVDGVLYTKDMKTLVQYPAGSMATELNVPEGVETVGFASCEGAMNLKKVTIPTSCKMLDGAALYKCESMTECIMHDDVETIGNEVFYGCVNLANFNIPKNIKTLASGVFTGCVSLTHMVVPEQITYIDFRLFYGCTNLKSVEMSSKVDVIDQEAFSGCLSLESMIIPKTVSYIGPLAFNDCNNMNTIYIFNESAFIGGAELSQIIPTDMDGNILENERILYVPTGCKEKYEGNDYWNHAKEIREFDPTAIDAAIATEDSVINVNGVDVNIDAKDGNVNIYTINGMLFDRFEVTEGSVEIPAGVYIINGKKVVVR